MVAKKEEKKKRKKRKRKKFFQSIIVCALEAFEVKQCEVIWIKASQTKDDAKSESTDLPGS